MVFLPESLCPDINFMTAILGQNTKYIFQHIIIMFLCLCVFRNAPFLTFAGLMPQYWYGKVGQRDNNGRLPPLQTDISHFCEIKYLLKKRIHNKNEDNTLEERNKIFLTVMVCLSKFLSEHYENQSESYVGRTPPPERLTD